MTDSAVPASNMANVPRPTLPLTPISGASYSNVVRWGATSPPPPSAQVLEPLVIVPSQPRPRPHPKITAVERAPLTDVTTAVNNQAQLAAGSSSAEASYTKPPSVEQPRLTAAAKGKGKAPAKRPIHEVSDSEEEPTSVLQKGKGRAVDKPEKSRVTTKTKAAATSSSCI